MAARQRRSRYMRKKKNPLTPILVTLLAIGVAGGGIYIVLKEQPKKVVKPKQKLKKQIASKRPSTKPKLKPKIELRKKSLYEKYQPQVQELLEKGSYVQVQELLKGVNIDSIAKRQDLEKLRGDVRAHARNRFQDDLTRVDELADSSNFEEAINILKAAQTWQIASIERSASSRIVEIQKHREAQAFFSKVEGFAALQAALGKPLRAHEYTVLGPEVDRLAASAEFGVFKQELMGMKGEVKLIEIFWRKVLASFQETIGAQENIGIHRGEVKAVTDGKIILSVKGAEIEIPPKDIPTSYIKRKLKMGEDSPPEDWYALGVLYAHEGRRSEAQKIFGQLGDDVAGVDIQNHWLDLAHEAEAHSMIQELKKAKETGQATKVIKLASELLGTYANTRVVATHQKSLKESMANSKQTLSELEEKIQGKLDEFGRLISTGKEEMNSWYSAKKEEIGKLFKEKMTDTRKYVLLKKKIGGGLVRSIGHDIYFVNGKEARAYFFRVSEETGIKDENLKVVRAAYKLLPKGTSNDIKSPLKKEIKRLEYEIKRAKAFRSDSYAQLKIRGDKKKKDLLNRSKRTERKIKAGEMLSTEEMKDALNLRN